MITSETLQQIAIFFELGGIALVALEVYRPHVSELAENYVHQFLEMPTFPDGRARHPVIFLAIFVGFIVFVSIASLFPEYATDDAFAQGRGWLIFIPLLVLGLGVMISSDRRAGPRPPENIVPRIEKIVWWCTIGPYALLAWPFFIIVHRSIRLVGQIAKGKFVTGVGLILTALGISCEIYQLVDLCFANDYQCYQFSEEV